MHNARVYYMDDEASKEDHQVHHYPATAVTAAGGVHVTRWLAAEMGNDRSIVA
jgi:hypothetical protein